MARNVSIAAVNFAVRPVPDFDQFAAHVQSLLSGCDLVVFPELFTLAEGLLWATVIGLYQDTLAGQFAQRFAAVHHSDSGRSGAGIHYDMVHLLSNTWRQVENPRGFAAVSRRLRQLVHRGVSGAYYFDNHGQTALTYPDDTPDASLAQAHLVHQIQGGQHVIVAPSPCASARFQPPHQPASGGSSGE